MIYFILIILNCSILFFYSLIHKKINIYDYPSENKIHTKKSTLIGWFNFSVNIIIYLASLILFNSNQSLNIFGFSSSINDLVFILSIFFLFFLGLVDDKKIYQFLLDCFY